MIDLYTSIYTGLRRMKAAMQGDNHFDLFSQFCREQWLPVDELEQIRLQRLRSILNRALNHSEYYKERFADYHDLISDLSSLDDLENLPLLTRDDLQNSSEQILCPVDNTVYSDSSGGSTGSPVNFYHDNDYRTFASGLHLLFLSWIKISYGDKTAVFWGADRDFTELSRKEKLMQKLERYLSINSFDIDDNKMNNFLDQLEQFDPTYIYGYASSLDQAARFINKSGRTNIRPIAVRSSAEMLYESQRVEIEKAFGCKVYNFYGSREINNLAAECPANEGLHLMASGRIVEVVDETGKRLPNGEVGYLAVTDLTNFSFPFIRYMTGDMAAMSDSPCSCGRSYPLIEKLVGRSSDIITIGDKSIHGEFFTHLFYNVPQVKQFQVEQDGANHLTVRIISRDGIFDTSEIADQMKVRTGQETSIDFEFVDDIKTLKSGKYRFTINSYRTKS